MMRRWMQTQATALPLKILRISGLTKKQCITTNGIYFNEKLPLLKRNSSIIPMTKAVTMVNVIRMQKLVGALPGYQQSSTYSSTDTNTNLTNSGTDTDIYSSIMDIDTDDVYGAGSLESGLLMDNTYYDHDGGRENLQQYINTNLILTDNNWKQCELKHIKKKHVAKHGNFPRHKRDQNKILKDEDKNTNYKDGFIDMKGESEVTSNIHSPTNNICQF